MSNKIFVMLLVAMVTSISIASAQFGESDAPRGYITLGDNVVILPDQLKQGDRLIVTTKEGTRVFDKTIGKKSSGKEDLGLNTGLYSVWFVRKGESTKQIDVSLNMF